MDAVVEALGAEGHRPVVVTGDRGSGRTSVLAAVADRVGAEGADVRTTTCLPSDRGSAFTVARRLLGSLTGGHEAGGAPVPHLPLALTRALRERGRVVLLVDDAQHADDESARLLRDLVAGPARGDVRLVLSELVHHPRPAPAGQVDVPLAPMDRDGVARALVRLLGAIPDGALVAEAHRLTAGNPAALVAVVEQLRRTGGIRVLIGHAHLLEGTPPPVLPDDDRFVRALRGLGATPWRVAKALGLLGSDHRCPSDTVVSVIESAGVAPGAVAEALDLLVASGFAERSGTPERLGFRVPLLAAAVAARMGPYERRAVSAAAVRHHWRHDRADAASPPDKLAFLADRIADGVALLDPKRAARELLDTGHALRFTHMARGARWMRVAATLLDDPVAQVKALTAHASAALRSGDHATAARESRELLTRFASAMDRGLRLDVAGLELLALAGTGDRAALAAAAEEHLRPTADAAHLALGAHALCLLGRWDEARRLLEGVPPVAQESAAEESVAEESAERWLDSSARWSTGLVHGDLADLRAAVARDGGRTRYDLTVHQYDSLLGVGELTAALDLLARRGVGVDQVPRQDVFLARFLGGDWERGLGTARSMMANTPASARMPVSVLAHAGASTMLLARGWPTRAASVLDAARATVPVPHLLAAATAAVHALLGDADAAEAVLRAGLADAGAHGYVLGTGELWAGLAECRAAVGDARGAADCVREVERVAGCTGVAAARLLALRTALRVDRTAGRPAEAVALARESGQPFELALTLLAAAEPGRAGRDHLLEAYELFGGLGAATWRNRTRTAMREAGVSVPGRNAAAAENEQLLARLVTEGLTNRQLAAVLQVSEGGIAGRLTRLFTKAGVRSRVELATAMRVEDYP
ncbi:AAA family ATPase [Saccharothrix sp. Mg75]|uniref:AAA family ATPase n=1 Tax=Saccharothrix sp. Mg75 TaxID=3445357 RepID=UPI003EEEA76B